MHNKIFAALVFELLICVDRIQVIHYSKLWKQTYKTYKESVPRKCAGCPSLCVTGQEWRVGGYNQHGPVSMIACQDVTAARV